MRYQEITEATAPKPSQALIDAVKQWINGWSPEARHKAENALWMVRYEAMQFVAPRYNMLYRGTQITETQLELLKRNKPIMIEMPRLASWTTHEYIAHDYASDGIGVVITKRRLKPILDVFRFMEFFPNDIDEKGIPDDYLRYARREGEVVCEHTTGPLKINPQEITIID